MGSAHAAAIAEAVAKGRYEEEISDRELRGVLAAEIAKVLKPAEKPFAIDRSKSPFVVLVAGVNGTGKTTTIGKLAKRLREQGLSVVLAAGDTFRAAAIEQLQVWASRTGAEIIKTKSGGDPAAVVYDALSSARARNSAVVIVDTAGPLHTQSKPVAAIHKMKRTAAHMVPVAPPDILLVIDATPWENGV